MILKIMGMLNSVMKKRIDKKGEEIDEKFSNRYANWCYDWWLCRYFS